jgi:RNA polymerase sigma-70 factor (ECF subfamily)
MSIPDFWLVRRAKSGDKDAFGALYDRHGPRVYNLLRRMAGGDTSLAEDLTQETFLSAYQSLANWRGVGAFSSWLCGIAVRCYRNQARRSGASLEEPLDEQAPASSESDPLLHYTRAEARQLLDTAIAELPPLCREVFVLVYVEGFAYREVATLLEVPLGTVQSRLNRAKRQLHTRLSDTFAEPSTPAKGANSHAL